jgi:iron complex outermembrane receptor protein
LELQTLLQSLILKYKYDISSACNIEFKTIYEDGKADSVGGLFPNGYRIGVDFNHDGIYDLTDINHDGVDEYWREGINIDLGIKMKQFTGESLLNYQISPDQRLIFGLSYLSAFYGDSHHRSNFVGGYRSTLVDNPNEWIASADRTNSAVFIQDELNLTKQLYLILGARYDNHNDMGNSFNPRYGLVWTSLDNNTAVKLLYGTAFRIPEYSFLYIKNNDAYLGNKNLKPETLKSYEMIVSKKLFENKMIATMSVYKIDITNVVVFNSQRPRYAENIGTNNIIGSEFDMKYVFGKNSNIFLSYYNTDSYDMKNMQTAFIPKEQISAGFNLNYKDRINWNNRIDYTGKRQREYSDPRPTLDPVTLVDTVLRFNDAFYKNVDIFLRVSNLFDTSYSYPAQLSTYPQDDIPAAGREYKISLSYSF